MSEIAILILAAGSSNRMKGGDKLLEAVDGEPLLRRTVNMAIASHHEVFVTLPEGQTRRAHTIADLNVTTVSVENADTGMSASLTQGIAALGKDVATAMVMLSDMPDVTLADIHTLLVAYEKKPDTIIRATDETGRPGHPVIFPRRLFGPLQLLTGDQGARDILKTEDVVLVPLPGRHATTDLDTPEDWASWRKANPGR